jgi:hypothetical protein
MPRTTLQSKPIPVLEIFDMKFVRRLALVVPAILLMGLPPGAWSQQRNAPKVPSETRTAAQIQAVTEFSFEGVSLGM